MEADTGRMKRSENENLKISCECFSDRTVHTHTPDTTQLYSVCYFETITTRIPTVNVGCLTVLQLHDRLTSCGKLSGVKFNLYEVSGPCSISLHV